MHIYIERASNPRVPKLNNFFFKITWLFCRHIGLFDRADYFIRDILVALLAALLTL